MSKKEYERQESIVPFRKGLRELKQIREEKESLKRSNQYYIAQVSQMEVRISELKAANQSKEKEINFYKNKLQEIRSSTDSTEFSTRSSQEIQTQMTLLKEENRILKEQIGGSGKLAELSVKLDHALAMKNTYEEKYRETKALLIKAENKSQQKTDYEELKKEIEELREENKYLKREKIPKLESKLEDAAHKQLELESQIERLLQENAKLQSKFEENEKKNYSLHTNSTAATRASIVSKKNVTFKPVQTSTKAFKPKTFSNISVQKGQLKQPSKAPPRTEHKHARFNTSSTQSKPQHEYIPSFMRSKKIEPKPDPDSPSSTETFADEFPDEDELA